jgi:ligand-binding sensor domain-containing protein
MRSLLVFLLLYAVISALPAAGQEGRWRAHTSLREVTGIAVSEEAVWTSTTGGIFRYVPSTGEISTYTAGEGLHSVQTRAITFDSVRDVVWLGYRDGVLDRLDPATGVVTSYRDIERADRFSSREINRIVVCGDSVYVATSFGVVVFDPVKNEVRDTYSQLGSISAGVPVHDLDVAPGPDGNAALWVATNDGIAWASMSAPNLKDPGSWTVEREGLPSEELRALAWFDGRIYVGTTSDLAWRTDEGTYQAAGLTGSGVFDLDLTPEGLIGVGRFDPFIVSMDGGARSIEIEDYAAPVAIALGPDGNVWIGDTQGGLIAIEPPGPSQQTAVIVHAELYPSGPYDNLFSGLEIDGEGTLWAAGILDAEAGFYRFDPPDAWTNYIRRFVPELEGASSFERIHVDGRGHAWAGSAGGSLAEVTPSGEIRMWDASNSTIRPASGSDNFIIIGGIASDTEENVWVTNRASPVPIHIYEPDGGWTGIPNVACDGFTTTGVTFDRIYIDSFGQVWVVVLDLANLRRVVGLLVLDINGTPGDTADDACRFFASEGSGGQGLPGTGVTSVVEDRDGVVWIGTEGGLAFMINSGIVARDPNAVPIWPQFADRSQGTFLLNGIQINDLAVDPANRVWAATGQGVTVIQQVEGGYEIADQFTSRNSPLFSDNVVAIAVDPASGHVYMATDQGLISYESDAIAASEQVQDLKVYPNPVRIEEGASASIFIEGLVELTDLRVVTLTGEVVARIDTRGGRARWDGRDTANRVVPSGVYLVVAVGENGEGTAYGKVAVIR